MKFAFLGYNLEQKWEALSKSEQDAMTDACLTYHSKLLKDGPLINDGTTLQPTWTAKTLRWRNGAVVVTDGPFAETKEQLGRVGVLEARDVDHAVELLSQHPGLQHGATFELRPINEESLRCQATAINSLRSGAPAVNLPAMRFASMGYINESGRHAISNDQFDAMLAHCKAFDEARVKSGQWLSGIGLQSARTAKTLRFQAGKIIVTDGPFAETKEQLGGVVVLAFKDWNDALASLSSHPALPFGVVIEIRPVAEEIDKRWQAQLARVE